MQRVLALLVDTRVAEAARCIPVAADECSKYTDRAAQGKAGEWGAEAVRTGVAFWIGAAILQLLVLVVLVVGPYVGLYGREDQREG